MDDLRGQVSMSQIVFRIRAFGLAANQPEYRSGSGASEVIGLDVASDGPARADFPRDEAPLAVGR